MVLFFAFSLPKTRDSLRLLVLIARDWGNGCGWGKHEKTRIDHPENGPAKKSLPPITLGMPGIVVVSDSRFSHQDSRYSFS